MAWYSPKTPIKSAGKVVPVGQPVEIDDDDAAELRALDAVEPCDPPGALGASAAAEPKKKGGAA